MIKLSTTLISSCLLLAGCQSAEVVEQAPLRSQATIFDPASLNVLAMKAPSEQTFRIDENSQRYVIDGVESPVAVVSLPLTSGALDITITSLISSSAFAPYVVVIRDDGSVVEQYDLNEFGYLPARFHLGNRLALNFTFVAPSANSKLMLVVYTKPEAATRSVTVTHPAKLDAKARGNYLPEVKDIQVPFSDQGEVIIAIDGRKSQANPTPSDEQVTQSKVIAAKATQESSEFYRQAITHAVDNNQLKKAVSLLEEAESLGVEGAREAFNKAVNAAASQ
ncbi:MalM family protein [Vibrio sp. CB1-14]|uniref:MalM family protein n=1 Tax=Vibrio chaetopteri TaxID=3016528 RepID=A0AAU8BNV4_9VIBR